MDKAWLKNLVELLWATIRQPIVIYQFVAKRKRLLSRQSRLFVQHVEDKNSCDKLLWAKILFRAAK